MTRTFQGWPRVARNLRRVVQGQARLEKSPPRTCWLDAGQRATLGGVAARIPKNGILLADEVGMGKTRIAVGLARAVVQAGGRVAILVPPGLGFQWNDELSSGGCTDVPPILRSLKGYFGAWDSPARPWHDEPIVVVSHVFANWRLSDRSATWRWALLPELYAQSRKANLGRWPRGYIEWTTLGGAPQVRTAGSGIYSSIPKAKGSPERVRMTELENSVRWPSVLESDRYVGPDDLRPKLERAIGLGLGAFDLIIIDEAHKGRGQETGLSRLIDNVLLESRDARRFMMTATPIELDIDQLQQSLTRLGLDRRKVTDSMAVVNDYASAVTRVRNAWPRRVDEAVNGYRQASVAFEKALSPYVLRRDKRENAAVRLFQDASGEPYDRYRRETDISVALDSLSPSWLQAICAAESLSAAVQLTSGSAQRGTRQAKLMWLTSSVSDG